MKCKKIYDIGERKRTRNEGRLLKVLSLICVRNSGLLPNLTRTLVLLSYLRLMIGMNNSKERKIIHKSGCNRDGIKKSNMFLIQSFKGHLHRTGESP